MTGPCVLYLHVEGFREARLDSEQVKARASWELLELVRGTVGST